MALAENTPKNLHLRRPFCFETGRARFIIPGLVSGCVGYCGLSGSSCLLSSLPEAISLDHESTINRSLTGNQLHP